MGQSNFFDSVRKLLQSLFGSQPGATGTPSQPSQPPFIPPPAGPVLTDEPLVPMAPRVLVIVYDPVVDALENLHLVQWGVQNRGWRKVEDLMAGYIADIDQASDGLLKYNVVQQINVDEFPQKIDGFRYTALEYIDMYTNHRDKYHQPDGIDYHKVIADFKLTERVNNNEIDEVWLFTFPFSGTWESTMCGTGAFWCNSAPQPNTSGRRFVIMGFSYERGIGEMEEDLGHRAESLLARVHRAEDFVGWTYGYDRSRDPYVKTDPKRYEALKYAETNLLAKFLLYDRIAPGNSQCGTVHYAPNSQKDYEWFNSNPVITYADDWLTYPNMPHTQKMENGGSWGDADYNVSIRKHHTWWFKRFPKVAGRLNGVRLNWWHYVADVTNPEFDATGEGSGGGIHVG